MNKEQTLTSFSLFVKKSANILLKIETQIPKYAGFLYIIMFSFFFSIGSMFVKLLTRVPIYQQMHISSLVSLCLCIVTEPSEKVPKDPMAYKLLLQRGIMGALGCILSYEMIYLLPLSIGTLFFLITPLWIGILGRLFYNEPFGFPHFLLTLASICGFLLIIQPEFLFENEGFDFDNYDKNTFIKGTIVGIIASFLGAIVFLTIRSLRGKVSVVMVLYYFNILSVFVGALGSFFDRIVKMETLEILLVILSGLFFFLGHIVRNRALYLETPFVVGLGSYLQLIVSYLFDNFIFGIQLNQLATIGCVVVVVSTMVLVYWNSKK